MTLLIVLAIIVCEILRAEISEKLLSQQNYRHPLLSMVDILLMVAHLLRAK